MKIGILISGRGSNMSAIAEAVNSGFIPNAEIAIVISDKADAQRDWKRRNHMTLKRWSSKKRTYAAMNTMQKSSANGKSEMLN